MILTLEEPTWGIPQNVDIQCTTFATAGISGSWLKGALVRFLQYHFSRSSMINQPALRCMTWGPDSNTSGIWIGGSGSLDKQNAGKLPKIIVKSGSVNQNRVSFMDSALAGISAAGLVQGVNRQRQESGSTQIMIVAVYEDAANALADEVYETLTYWAPILKNELSLSGLQVLQKTEASKVPDGVFQQDPVYICKIMLNWAYIRRWRLNRMGPVLKRVALAYSIFEDP